MSTIHNENVCRLPGFLENNIVQAKVCIDLTKYQVLASTSSFKNKAIWAIELELALDFYEFESTYENIPASYILYRF